MVKFESKSATNKEEAVEPIVVAQLLEAIDEEEDDEDDDEEEDEGEGDDFLGIEMKALIFSVAARLYSSTRLARSSSEVIDTRASKSSVGN